MRTLDHEQVRGKRHRRFELRLGAAMGAALENAVRFERVRLTVGEGNDFTALLDVHPRDRTRDHQLLDLGGALEDVVDPSKTAW